MSGQKRPRDDLGPELGARKRRNKTVKDDYRNSFRPGLFEQISLEDERQNYTYASPSVIRVPTVAIYADNKRYRHGVISQLIEPNLLKNVRQEILENLSFTPKETDIYKIHQSGDLANLDGLDDASLKRLPSLLTLRNALYSSAFREFLSLVTNAGPLSGRKTDMAINVYTPGCHLLCHDDVIGSRRVSYILYLLDPEQQWGRHWGGALRLYPTKPYKSSEGTLIKVPASDPTKLIQPAWNQLSFFAVEPGQSFHDVEEVLAARREDLNEQRVRMAISGWYHIPQEGEVGFQEGLEEELAATSSLTQLQSKNDEYDLPKANPKNYMDKETQLSSSSTSNPGLQNDSNRAVDMKTNGTKKVEPEEDTEDDILTESDINVLLKYLQPTFLTPDTIDSLRRSFEDSSALLINGFLNPTYAKTLRDFIESQPDTLPHNTKKIEAQPPWMVACPPHKHRYLFMTPNAPDPNHQNLLTTKQKEVSPLKELLTTFLSSPAFGKWLHLATDLTLSTHDVRARRFRRGYDYSLATGYEEEQPRLEMTLGLTPSKGWEEDENEAEGGEGTESDKKSQSGEVNDNTTKKGPPQTIGTYAMADSRQLYDPPKTDARNPDDNVGGYEVYMTSDSSSNDAKLADPAVYQAAGDEDEDDGILFSMAAGWDRLSLVLRDKGVMKFVKYVSAKAEGDRWDVVGEFGVVDNGGDEDDAEHGVQGDEENGEEEEEEENGEEEEEEEVEDDDDESTTDLAEAAEEELDSDSD
ncbi:hypothetical protein MMC18_000918 [Xylographa bjoerkii]|nr:hypothetical protein [Xylographa bjoerkii]